MAIETVTDLVNVALRCNTPALPHNLDDMAKAIFREALPNLQLALAVLMRDPYLRRAKAKQAAYVEIFVDNFLGFSKGPAHRRCRVRQTLFHTLDKASRPCDYG